MSERREEIVEILRGRILRGLHAGSLVPGDRLPSARELEADFDLDHRIVLAAYRELAAEGLIEMRQRGGIYVARRSAGPLIPTPPEGWLVELLCQSLSREVPVVELHEWLRRSVETLRLRAVAIQGTQDTIAGLCRELADDYGLEAAGVDAAALRGTDDVTALPPAVRRADLLVTTQAYEGLVRRIAERLGKPYIVAAVRADLVGGEWRLLLRRPVYVVVRDERFVTMLRQFLRDAPGAENVRALVAGRDDLSAIPDGAPTYVTRSAREVIGDAPIAGRIIPSARIFSAESARALIEFIVRANMTALAARRAP